MKKAQFDVHAELEERHWWFTGRRKICTALVRRLLPPGPTQGAHGDSRAASTGTGHCVPRKVVLDAGCGTGGNIAALSGDYSCMGMDPAPEAIALARKRFPLVRFEQGRVPEDLVPLAPSVDLFLFMDVLEHVPDDTALLEPVVAAARPGSHFLITVPADMKLWSSHDVSFGHFRRYDRLLLEKAWSGLPVTPVMVSYYNHRLYPLALFARSLSRLRGKTWGEAGTDFTLPAPPVNRLLESIFSGETDRLMDLMEKRRTAGYSSGVSLIAILRREPSHAR